MMLNQGLNKLAEESSELATVCCKWESCEAQGLGHIHYDGSNMKERTEEEIADVLAAIHYVVWARQLNFDLIRQRSKEKLALFEKWAKE